MKLSEIIIRELRKLPGGYNPTIHDPIVEGIIKSVAPRLKDDADLSEHTRKSVLGLIQEISISNMHLHPENAVTAMGVGLSLVLIQMYDSLYLTGGYKAAKTTLELTYEKVIKGGNNGLEHNGGDSERRTERDREES